MTRPALSACVALALAAPAGAVEEPQPGPKDPRVLAVAYDPWQVVRILGTPTTSTQIVFGPDEQIERVAIGDTEGWIASPAGNLLFLKPSAVRPRTDMQVITLRPDKKYRDYVFELEALEATTGPSGVTGYYKVVFSYPEPAKPAAPQRKRSSPPALADTASAHDPQPAAQ